MSKSLDFSECVSAIKSLVSATERRDKAIIALEAAKKEERESCEEFFAAKKRFLKMMDDADIAANGNFGWDIRVCIFWATMIPAVNEGMKTSEQ